MLSLRKLLLDSSQRRFSQPYFEVVSRGQDSKYFMNTKLTSQIFIKNVNLPKSKSSKSGNIQLSIGPAACMSYYIFLKALAFSILPQLISKNVPPRPQSRFIAKTYESRSLAIHIIFKYAFFLPN